MHQGTLEVESAPGQGSVLTIVLGKLSALLGGVGGAVMLKNVRSSPSDFDRSKSLAVVGCGSDNDSGAGGSAGVPLAINGPAAPSASPISPSPMTAWAAITSAWPAPMQPAL